MRPQDTPHAKADSKDNVADRVLPVQQTGDALAGCQDGRTADYQGAPKSIHEESQGGRGETLNHYKDIWVVLEGIRAVQVACIQAAAQYGRELWWDPKDIGRQDDLQLLLNQPARSVLGALPTTPRGALIRESWLTPMPVIIRLQTTMIRSDATKRMQEQTE